MKKSVWLAILAFAPWFCLPAFAQEYDPAQTEPGVADSAETASEPAPKAESEIAQSETAPSEGVGARTLGQYDKSFGLGACLGRGAGLFGVYAYLRPADVIAFEAAAGSRLFLYQTNSYYGDTSEVYWPAMGSLKLQFYFNKKTTRFQSGMEVGVTAAEDAGWGGEISWIMHFRLVKNLYLDGNAGLGAFPDVKNSTLDYLVRIRGGSRQSYESSEILTSPVYLMWGAGLSYMF